MSEFSPSNLEAQNVYLRNENEDLCAQIERLKQFAIRNARNLKKVVNERDKL
jgi:cell division protein FtsB